LSSVRFYRDAPSLLRGDVTGRWTFVAAGLARDLLEKATILPPMFSLVSLFDVCGPREFVAQRVGRDTGVGLMPWMVDPTP